MINKIILIGNLGRDPEVRRLESGAVVAKFSIATNENYKDRSGNWQQNTEWHDIVAWRLLAEKAENQLKKGSMVYIEGKLTHRKWEDQDGNPRKTTEVVANYLRAIGGRDDNDSNSGYFPSADDEPSTAKESTPDKVAEEVTDTAEDDLPF